MAKQPSTARRRRHVLVLTLKLLLIQSALAETFYLRVDGNDEPYCNGGLDLLSLQVECTGPKSACDFSGNVRLTGSILSQQTLPRTASVDVVAFMDDVTARHLSQSSNVDLCNYVNSIESGNGGAGSSCSSGNTEGQTFAFDLTYNINYVDGTDGWWFRYCDRIAVEVEITDTTSKDQFSATCRTVLIVKHVYVVTGNFPTSPKYARVLYWGVLGLATIVSGFWIGYAIRRNCDIGCSEVRRIVGGCEKERYSPGSALAVEEGHRRPHSLDDVVQHDSPAFRIMNDPPFDSNLPPEPATLRIHSNPLT